MGVRVFDFNKKTIFDRDEIGKQKKRFFFALRKKIELFESRASWKRARCYWCTARGPLKEIERV